jgi:hypothetical protein
MELSIEVEKEAIGGIKGHIVEEIDGHILTLFRACNWKPIPRCTGRYTCREHSVSELTPRELLVERAGIIVADKGSWSLTLPGRPDKVEVVPLDAEKTVGVITYVKEEIIEDYSESSSRKRYIHTLNTPSGFRRKLNAIGVSVTNEDIQVDRSGSSPPH